MSLKSFNHRLSTLVQAVVFTSLASSIALAMPALAQDRSAWLMDNGRTTMTGYLLQGESLYGLCDNDCKDLNLKLFNEMGIMVDADTGASASPVVTAPYEGTFRVEVSVPSCTHWAGCEVSLSSDHGF